MLVSGTYTALVTPFTSTGEVDITAYKKLLHMQVEAGIDGIVILGTTGEAPTIRDEERVELVRVAVEALTGKTRLFVGCGTNSTEKTVHYAQEAQALGADGVLVITPYYNRPTQEGLYQHCKQVAESISLPCCIYNAPKRTGQNLEPETVARLAHIPNVCLKECNEDLQKLTAIIAQAPSGFAIMSGTDYLTLPFMALGAHGVISVLSNLLPGAVKHLVTAMQQGDWTTARSLHYALNPLVEAAFIETNPVPIKRMMELAGLCSATVRLPLVPLAPHNDRILQEKVRHATKPLFHPPEALLSFSRD